MSPRATALLQVLQLQPHPEGGFYREVFRSESVVQADQGRPERSALTTIYFLLPAGAISRWHRVLSDEVWHYYEGAPLELVVCAGDPETAPTTPLLLGPVAAGQEPVRVVPAGWWQAARSRGEYTLVGCTVGPGFAFADFTLRDHHPFV